MNDTFEAQYREQAREERDGEYKRENHRAEQELLLVGLAHHRDTLRGSLTAITAKDIAATKQHLPGHEAIGGKGEEHEITCAQVHSLCGSYTTHPAVFKLTVIR